MTHNTSTSLKRARSTSDTAPSSNSRGTWTADEHERFLQAMEIYPIGPWSAIAEFVGTRSVRQVHSHAQKYAAKVERHKVGRGKAKRGRVAGEENYASGHRIVPRIVGKFSATPPQEPTEDHKGLDGRTDEREYALAWCAESPGWGDVIAPLSSVSTSAPSSPVSVHSFQNEVRRNDERFELLPLSRDSFELPSLDESLDFFLSHLSSAH